MTALDCDDKVCPLVDATITCQVDIGPTIQWAYSSPSYTLIGSVSGDTIIIIKDGYTAEYIDSGESTLTFNATADRNKTVIECRDNGDGDTGTCTIMISGYINYNNSFCNTLYFAH